jgi:hypothetical protein
LEVIEQKIKGVKSSRNLKPETNFLSSRVVSTTRLYGHKYTTLTNTPSQFVWVNWMKCMVVVKRAVGCLHEKECKVWRAWLKFQASKLTFPSLCRMICCPELDVENIPYLNMKNVSERLKLGSLVVKLFSE